MGDIKVKREKEWGGERREKKGERGESRVKGVEREKE